MKPASQNTVGGSPAAQAASWASRACRSRVQAPSGFRLGYAFSHAAGTWVLGEGRRVHTWFTEGLMLACTQTYEVFEISTEG